MNWSEKVMFTDRPRRFSILFAKTDLPNFMTDLADSQMDFTDIETDLLFLCKWRSKAICVLYLLIIVFNQLKACTGQINKSEVKLDVRSI